MGVHTGDSITVAPAQTLTDREYQRMRDAAHRDHPRDRRRDRRLEHPVRGQSRERRACVVIEMNPRVSRSSALASKATGFPIAKIAAKLAVGYTLDEIPNDITREDARVASSRRSTTSSSRSRSWAFEKFPGADADARHADEVGRRGDGDRPHVQGSAVQRRCARSRAVKPLRLDDVPRRRAAAQARASRTRSAFSYITLRAAARLADRRDPSTRRSIDPWFLDQIAAGRWRFERDARRHEARRSLADELLRAAKRMGFSDRRLAYLTRRDRGRGARRIASSSGIAPVYKRVDTCAAEFEAYTPYLYSTYEDEDEAAPTDRRKIMILGVGPEPHRPGHRVRLLLLPRRVRAARGRLRDDHGQLQPGDGLDRLRHVRPALLRAADVRGRDEHRRRGEARGRDRAVRRADAAESGDAACTRRACRSSARRPTRSTSPRTASASARCSPSSNIPQPDERHGDARSTRRKRSRREIGYPVLVRPSYVLGGRAMAIVYDERALDEYMRDGGRGVARAARS